MAQLTTKIKKYLNANSKTWEDERDNIAVVNNGDGNGDFIDIWNVSGLAEPTADQIASYETAGNTEEANNNVRSARRLAYGIIGDQLDLLYKDMLADKGDKTGEWFKAIKAVKDANSKE